MPRPIPIPDGEVPTIISKPNQRFAVTALSTEYRKYAVNGEFLKDNTTGELFLKRKDDGKIVSFFQNKKYLHDIMLELRVLLSTHPGFRYPSTTEESFFISSNYDLVSINKEERLNIYNENLSIDNTDETLYTLKFKVSNRCNGFFVRLNTRDCDKPVVEVITNFYNTFIKSYSGTDPLYLGQKALFTATKWEDSNASIVYQIHCEYEGDESEPIQKTYICEEYIRLNESCFVQLPELDILRDFPNGCTSITVAINEIRYDKIHFMLENQYGLPEAFKKLLDKYLFQEARIESQVINIMSIVDNPDDYIPLGNDTILAFIDLPYMHRYMGKMTSLLNKGDYIFSIDRPLDSDWVTNGVWAEMIRTIDQNGRVTITGSENSTLIGDLEDIFGPSRIHHGLLTINKNRLGDYLLTNIVEYRGGDRL